MKKQFADFVRSLGGYTKYSGGTEQPVMSEPVEQTHVVRSGRSRINSRQYRRKNIVTGFYAGKKLLGMKLMPKTMYVHGLDEAKAEQLATQYTGQRLPFQVVFQ